LNNTHDYGIIFGGLNVIDQLEGFCDIDYVANLDTFPHWVCVLLWKTIPLHGIVKVKNVQPFQ
jgi:hypothetical protein